ncbi:hypothetical protein BDY19DRAFT_907471 [Irpex rosettiformis]|uniref:Uncharacterized protein n=1 Tax=Irpex rosettiformis TaxID=378272 RepID=A0ACB8TZZ8_9APHY|nr:hypothetical protein BDY19DRAFT_907471 [Irpex rosettiformis]
MYMYCYPSEEGTTDGESMKTLFCIPHQWELQNRVDAKSGHSAIKVHSHKLDLKQAVKPVKNASICLIDLMCSSQEVEDCRGAASDDKAKELDLTYSLPLTPLLPLTLILDSPQSSFSTVSSIVTFAFTFQPTIFFLMSDLTRPTLLKLVQSLASVTNVNALPDHLAFPDHASNPQTAKVHQFHRDCKRKREEFQTTSDALDSERRPCNVSNHHSKKKDSRTPAQQQNDREHKRKRMNIGQYKFQGQNIMKHVVDHWLVKYDLEYLPATKPAFWYIDREYDIVKWDDKSTKLLVDGDQHIFVACVSREGEWSLEIVKGFCDALAETQASF